MSNVDAENWQTNVWEWYRLVMVWRFKVSDCAEVEPCHYTRLISTH